MMMPARLRRFAIVVICSGICCTMGPPSQIKDAESAVLSAETFWTFVRELSSQSPFIAQISSSSLPEVAE
jgi:hypothetical protein